MSTIRHGKSCSTIIMLMFPGTNRTKAIQVSVPTFCTAVCLTTVSCCHLIMQIQGIFSFYSMQEIKCEVTTLEIGVGSSSLCIVGDFPLSSVSLFTTPPPPLHTEYHLLSPITVQSNTCYYISLVVVWQVTTMVKRHVANIMRLKSFSDLTVKPVA
jgi:hypothetical protein